MSTLQHGLLFLLIFLTYAVYKSSAQDDTCLISSSSVKTIRRIMGDILQRITTGNMCQVGSWLECMREILQIMRGFVQNLPIPRIA